MSDPWKIAGVGGVTAGMTAFDRYRYAQRLFGERRYTAAARELDRLITEEREYADGQGGSAYLGDAPLLLARAYYHSAQLGKAEQAARDLIAADPTEVYAVLLLARTLQRRGRHGEAGSWLRRLDAMGYDTWSAQFSPVASDDPDLPDPDPDDGATSAA